MTDAEALAACGDSVVPYLAKQDGWSAAQRAACVRSLGLIGGLRARRCLESYTHDATNTVREEHGCFPAWVTPSSLVELRATQFTDVSGDEAIASDKLRAFFERAVTRAIEQEIAVKDRHTLAIALGWLGDSRVTVDLRVGAHPDEHPGYVKIPAGEYYIGEQKKRITINDPFWLSKYPVWADGCLATEQQWEGAVRGPEGFEYPWGDDWENGICNSSEARLGSTSAVGIFPRNRSPFGVMDMAGNVWEWCNSRWEPGAADRMSRGGSWGGVAWLCRAACRYGVVPRGRGDGLGFRVAAVPPS